MRKKVAPSNTRFISGTPSACQVESPSNELLAYINANGEMTDPTHRPIGYVDKQGFVYDYKHCLFGEISPEREFYNNQKRLIGRLRSDWFLVDAHERKIGFMRDGSLYNAEHRLIIKYSKGTPPTKFLAWLIFFSTISERFQ